MRILRTRTRCRQRSDDVAQLESTVTEEWGERLPRPRGFAFPYLVPKDPDGAGGGHFVRTEPHRRDARRHPEDEGVRQRREELAQKGDGEEVPSDADHLDPAPDAVERRGHQSDDAEPLPVQQPGRREDQGNVSQHVDHGHPVDGEGFHAVELGDDVVDAAVLDPLEGAAQGVGAEQEDDHPASLVQAGGELLLMAVQPLVVVALRLRLGMVVRTHLGFIRDRPSFLRRLFLIHIPLNARTAGQKWRMAQKGSTGYRTTLECCESDGKFT